MRLLIFFLFLFPVRSFAFHVVLDPGHGGQDLGAVRDSFVEADIVFSIAEKVKAQLEKQNLAVTTLTRPRDRGISLRNRVELANSLKADLFVSLHANTSGSESVSGMEFYFNSPKPHRRSEDPPEAAGPAATPDQVIEKIKSDFLFYSKTEKSLILTRSLKGKTSEPEKKNVIRRAPFYVVDHTQMPSVLIELGFISNRREAKKLITEEYQQQIARQLSDAILEYKEKSDKLRPL